MCSGSEVSSFTIMQPIRPLFAQTEATWRSCAVTLSTGRPVTEQEAFSALPCHCFIDGIVRFPSPEPQAGSPHAAAQRAPCAGSSERSSVREGALRIN